MKARTLLLLSTIALTATTCPDRNLHGAMQLTNVFTEPYYIPINQPTTTVNITLKDSKLLSNSDSILLNFSILTESEGLIHSTSKMENIPRDLTKNVPWNLTYELTFDFQTQADSIPLLFNWTIYHKDHFRTAHCTILAKREVTKEAYAFLSKCEELVSFDF